MTVGGKAQHSTTMVRRRGCRVGIPTVFQYMMVVWLGEMAFVSLNKATIFSSTAHDGPLCVGPFEPQRVYL